jgi:hypothetical protein
MKLTQCKPGSAWETWQQIGKQWRNRRYNVSASDIDKAAQKFADESGWPQAARASRKRAFMEGAYNW